ncbi:hypothetical protein Q7C_1828 [Methylophaga frappieri]|jgi:TolA-binding protein|uniref:Uncharacterized protein n=1 Tax=Methylophaga frappieri (strain ATCC BAA-2434 / DSM 25690 / JAM7) TaxID=754477 RepID=I1YJ76_METFJ|nr:DUF6776 family protein [Methylophaga frappieri]AFJ02969.1 hypothetical protein Q7C_1828 [Methylophaga frappieri]
MTSPLGHLEIRQRRPFRCLLWIVLVALLLGAAQWYYHQFISAQQIRLQTENVRLNDALDTLQQQYQEVTASSVNLQQLQAMHKATTEKLESRLQQLQTRVINLNKELLFYQNITQGNVSSALQVRELQLRQDNDDTQLIRYRLVITQGSNVTEPLTGTVLLQLQPAATDVESINLGEHALNLRYVQIIEGSFALPATAVARLQVKLTQKDKTLLSQDFNWQEINPTD